MAPRGAVPAGDGPAVGALSARVHWGSMKSREALSVPPPGVSVSGLESEVLGDVGYREPAMRPRRMLLVRRWFSVTSLVLAAVTWPLFGAGVAGVADAFTHGRPGALGGGALYLAVLGWLSWRALAGLVNRTTFEVDDEGASVRHGPIPWPGEVTVAWRDVERIHCVQNVHANRHGTSAYSWDLRLRMKSGEDLRLLRRLREFDQVTWIARALAHRSGVARDPYTTNEFPAV